MNRHMSAMRTEHTAFMVKSWRYLLGGLVLVVSLVACGGGGEDEENEGGEDDGARPAIVMRA